jgi:drug/metabolite transporter (DMT)-like permease
MLQENKKKYLSVLIFLTLGFIWGSSFILMKRSMFSITGDPLLRPQEVALFRLIIAMLALSPIVFLHWKRIPKKSWKYLFVVGIFGNGIPAFLFAFGQTEVSSSLAGILNATVPLFTLILGTVFYSIKSSIWNKLGVVLGFIGVSTIIIGGHLDLQYNRIIYPGMIILATLFYAISVNTVKRYLTDLRSIDITSFAIFTVGLPSLIYLLFSTIPVRIIEYPELKTGLMYTAILALASTAFALILYNWLIKMSTALFASSVTYLIPLVAVMWGVLDGEILAFLQLIGGFILLIGVYLVYKRK